MNKKRSLKWDRNHKTEPNKFWSWRIFFCFIVLLFIFYLWLFSFLILWLLYYWYALISLFFFLLCILFKYFHCDLLDGKVYSLWTFYFISTNTVCHIAGTRFSFVKMKENWIPSHKAKITRRVKSMTCSVGKKISWWFSWIVRSS